MVAWMATGMALLAAFLGQGGGGIPLLPAGIDPFEQGGLQLPWVGKGRRIATRRRRRRALTVSDKNDIAFIAATLGETTGRKFALLVASRVF